MPNPAAASQFEGREIAGCRLIRRIGAGGAGEVYLAQQHRLGDRPVAIKVVRPRTDLQQRDTEDVSRQFLREGRLLASFAHPNILPVHDSGRADDLLYLVMQYVPEGSLADELRGRAAHPLHPPLPLSQVVTMVSQIAAALQYTHDHGVVHRDVKPGNVLVQVRPDGQRHLWLADFGIAGGDDESTVRLTQVSGTATYMAPEQFTGRCSPASDQYSLAVIAYQLLTGRPPFGGPPTQLVHDHRYTPAPSLRSLNPAVPSAVEAVIFRALSKRPEQRYRSVADFAQALRMAAASDSGTTASNRDAPEAPLAAAGAVVAGNASGPEFATSATTRPLPAYPLPTRGQPAQVYTGTTEAATPLSATAPALRPYPAGAIPPVRRRANGRSVLLALGLGLFLLALVLAAGLAWRSGAGPTPTGQSGPSGPINVLPTATSGGGSSGPSGGPANTPAPTATAPLLSQPPTVQTAPASTPGATPPATPTPASLYAPTSVQRATSPDQARLVTLSVPPSAAPGQHLSATLVFQNTGTSTWTTPGGYRLTCDTLRHPDSSCVPGMFVGFADYTIRPGDTLTYTVALTAPAAPGAYVVWLNMEHGTSLFPTPDVLVRLVVVPPTPTPTLTPTPSPTPVTAP